MNADTRRRLVTAVVAVSLGLVLFLAVWVASTGPALDWSADDGSADSAPVRVEPSEQSSELQRCVGDECGGDHGTFALIVLGLVVVVGVLLLAALVALFWSRVALSVRRRRRSVASEGPGVPLPDVGEAVREDAEEQHAALHAGAPRNAIVACWVRLEDAVVSAGLTVRGSETSTELTQRVLATYLVDDAALVRLAALYREARFSRHDITEAMRVEAVEALEDLHDGLAIPTRSGGAMQ